MNKFFDGIDSILGPRARFKVRVHALGGMRPELFQFPFWSCDATSWCCYGSSSAEGRLLVPHKYKEEWPFNEESDSPLDYYWYDADPGIDPSLEETKQIMVNVGGKHFNMEPGWAKLVAREYVDALGFDLDEFRLDITNVDLLNLLYFLEMNSRSKFKTLAPMKFYFSGQVAFNCKPAMESRLIRLVQKHIIANQGWYHCGRLVSYGDSRDYFGVYPSAKTGKPYSGDMTAEMMG
jgi:hypothetical protein